MRERKEGRKEVREKERECKECMRRKKKEEKKKKKRKKRVSTVTRTIIIISSFVLALEYSYIYIA